MDSFEPEYRRLFGDYCEWSRQDFLRQKMTLMESKVDIAMPKKNGHAVIAKVFYICQYDMIVHKSIAIACEQIISGLWTVTDIDVYKKIIEAFCVLDQTDINLLFEINRLPTL